MDIDCVKDILSEMHDVLSSLTSVRRRDFDPTYERCVLDGASKGDDVFLNQLRGGTRGTYLDVKTGGKVDGSVGTEGVVGTGTEGIEGAGSIAMDADTGESLHGAPVDPNTRLSTLTLASPAPDLTVTMSKDMDEGMTYTNIMYWGCIGGTYGVCMGRGYLSIDNRV